jgi:hypothetical protein
LLQCKQAHFSVKSTCEARELSCGADYAMARHNDGYRIPPGRGANGSGRLGIPQLPSQFAIPSCFAKRYGEQSFPYVSLERRSPQIEWNPEVLSLSGKILGKLPLCLNEHPIGLAPYRLS